MCKENLRKLETSRFRPYCAACVVSLLQLMFGMCIGWMSPATIELESVPPQIVDGDPLTADQINWLGSVTFIGCIVGILFWGSVAEKIGRKNTLRLLALPIIMGWTLISLAKSVKLMYLGRFILGLSGVGAIVPIQLYLNEISEPSYKGTLTSVMIFFFNGGIAMSYILGAFLSLKHFTLICNILPFFYLTAFHFFPESPVYLYRKNRTKQAEMSLLWFRNNDYLKVQQELLYLEENITYQKNDNTTSFTSIYDGRARAYALMINVWLFLASQFCGILVMLTYTSSIIKNSGTTLIEPDNGAVIVGVLQLIFSWMTTLILEKTSRKLLLMLSMGGMFISQAILGWYFLGDYSQVFPNWLPVVCICLHVGCYTFGVGPVTYVISAEITHPKIQPTAFSLFCFLGTAASFVSIKIYPYLIHYVGKHGCFWFYALWCLVSMFLIPKFLPETRGLTFEQITESLENNHRKNDDYHQCAEVQYDVHSKQIAPKV